MFEERFNRLLDRLWGWCRWQVGLIQGKSRTVAGAAFQPSLGTGALVLAALAFQVVSGGLLLIYYQPSVSPTLTLCGQAPGLLSSSPAAWCSTYYIVHSVPMGAVLLTSHLYGAYVVIFLVLLHLFRGYYLGAYKKPGGRSSWVGGVILLLLTLGMGFTGYLLAYTQLSYNATQVSITLLQALPVVGPALANLLVGDGTSQSLLSRMFALHVVLLPAAIAVFAFLHKRSPLFPREVAQMLKWGLLYVGLLLAVAWVWLWPLPTYAGNVSVVQPVTVPPWYFLWVFKLVDFIGVTPEDAMLFAAVVLLFLLFLPLLDRSRSADPRDRPVFLFLGSSLLGFFILLTAWGDLAPGVPVTPTDVALRLGPIVVANACAVAYFYRRYRRTSNESRPQAAPTTGPGTVEARESSPGGPPEGPSRAPSLLSPTSFAGMGIVASLFLLSFGLVLPFVFLLAAFLVSLAESSRAPPARGSPSSPNAGKEMLFPIVGFLSVLVLLVVLVVSVLA